MRSSAMWGIAALSARLGTLRDDMRDVAVPQQLVERGQRAGANLVELPPITCHALLEQLLDIELLIGGLEVGAGQLAGQVEQLVEDLRRRAQFGAGHAEQVLLECD